MPTFYHEKLVAYRRAIEFMSKASEIVGAIQPRNAHLRDQLWRATTSIALNIAEGAGEFKRAEKHRFYRMARRSAAECAAVIDILRATDHPQTAELDAGDELLDKIIAMLTTMSMPDGKRARATRAQQEKGERRKEG